MRISGDAAITAAVTAGVGLVGAFASWLAGKRQARVGLQRARADVIRAAQEAAHLVIQDLRDEVDRIKADRLGLLEEHAECRRDLASLRLELAALHASLAELRRNQAALK